MTARDLLAAATPRPWYHAADSLYGAPVPPPSEPFEEDAWEKWFDNADHITWGDVQEHDAALIVAAVNEYEAHLALEEVARRLDAMMGEGRVDLTAATGIEVSAIFQMRNALKQLDAARSGS